LNKPAYHQINLSSFIYLLVSVELPYSKFQFNTYAICHNIPFIVLLMNGSPLLFKVLMIFTYCDKLNSHLTTFLLSVVASIHSLDIA